MHVLVFAGTRPEAIKMAPVITALREKPEFRVSVCATGQHKEMLARAFADFHIVPDYDLAVMTSGQSLAGLSALLFQHIDDILAHASPDWALVQGDTTTVMIAALCAFYRRIHVGHVEAGLRSFNRSAPFPEEVNRRVAGAVADLHFAPTRSARENLLREGINEADILVTGNTVVDALFRMRELVRQEPPNLPEPLRNVLGKGGQTVLITGHRRENFGQGLLHICEGLRTLAQMYPATSFVYPVHLNPRVQAPVHEHLAGVPNVLLLDPLSYKPFIALMERSDLILTDSGGIQEEAAVLGKPVLILRETTERPEGVNAGAAVLVGTDPERIVTETGRLLADPALRLKMGASGTSLYGSGDAAPQIADALLARKRNG